jgi:hypothetical protein
MTIKEAVTLRKLAIADQHRAALELQRQQEMAEAREANSRTVAILQASLTDVEYETLDVVNEYDHQSPQSSRVFFRYERQKFVVKSSEWGQQRHLHIRSEDYCHEWQSYESPTMVIPNLWTHLVDYITVCT